jgi:raffinose/stachyose/melibiose transport system permease protein
MTTQKMRLSHSSNRRITAVLQHLIAVFFALVVLIPLLLTVLNSFKTNAELLLHPFRLPSVWHWENYTSVLQNTAFWRQLWNSTLVMAAAAFGVVVLASMPAFVFARMAFRGRELLLHFFTLGLMFPLGVATLPLYIMLRQMNLIDQLWGVILPQVAFGLPGSILMLSSSFATVPREIEEAAMIDGCTPVGFFIRVLLPLMRPILATVAVLTIIASWNDFGLPLLVLNKEQLYTLPLGMMQFQEQFSIDWARVMAFVSLSLVPTIGFYLIAERQIIAGLTAGAVKG